MADIHALNRHCCPLLGTVDCVTDQFDYHVCVVGMCDVGMCSHPTRNAACMGRVVMVVEVKNEIVHNCATS